MDRDLTSTNFKDSASTNFNRGGATRYFFEHRALVRRAEYRVLNTRFQTRSLNIRTCDPPASAFEEVDFDQNFTRPYLPFDISKYDAHHELIKMKFALTSIAFVSSASAFTSPAFSPVRANDVDAAGIAVVCLWLRLLLVFDVWGV